MMLAVRQGLLATTLAMSIGLVCAAEALADSPVGMCVPSAGGTAITTPTSGTTCAAGSSYKQLAAQTDLDAAKTRIAALEAKLADVTKLTVNGQPTVRFSGVNVQVVNGSGQTTTTNAKGNLILGYNDTPGNQNGSHNIIIGPGQAATSYGSIVTGRLNNSSGPYQALFGDGNRATNSFATILGGHGNLASARLSTISGGCGNTTGFGSHPADNYCIDPAQAGQLQTVSGGTFNTASGTAAVIAGGYGGLASSKLSSITGGCENTTGTATPNTDSYCFGAAQNNALQSVTGGQYGIASGQTATVTGGFHSTASGYDSTVHGGTFNTASGNHTSIAGGASNTASGDNAFIGGGFFNNASGSYTSIAGGESNVTSAVYAAILGGYGGVAAAATSSILGGCENTAGDPNRNISSFCDDSDLSGWFQTIGGGTHGLTTGTSSSVNGGVNNAARNDFAVVSGGRNNKASGLYSSIAGGNNSTVSAQDGTYPAGP
jgi:hypothetical protein